MHNYRFTITLSAIRAAAKRVREFQTLDIAPDCNFVDPAIDANRDTIADAIDAAVGEAWDNDRVQEVVDTLSDSADTRVARVVFKDQKLVAILVARRSDQMAQYRSGREKHIVVSLCTYHEAHSCFMNDEWRAIPGQVDARTFARPSSGGAPPTLTAEVAQSVVRPVAPTRRIAAPPPGALFTQLTAATTEPADDDAKPARGGTVFERTEYAKQVLRERPNIPTTGPDGLTALVKKKFGTGMSASTIRQLRDILAAEARTPEALAKKAEFLAECETVYKGPPSLAERLAAAIEAEITAGAALDAARIVVGDAQAALDLARQEVDALQSQMLANRPARGAAPTR